MADQRISVRHRVEAIEQLDQLARYLNSMSAWLAERGLEVEADAIDVAAKNCLAACWWLERPLRVQLPPQRWPDPARQFEPGFGSGARTGQGQERHRRRHSSPARCLRELRSHTRTR